MSESLKPNGRDPAADGNGDAGSRATTCPGLSRSRWAALTRFAAVALADMGISDPDVRLLEPVARTIHELGAPGQEEDLD
ncbi:hypothetical protein ACFLT5_01315 [Chloroflexota bacterium]